MKISESKFLAESKVLNIAIILLLISYIGWVSNGIQYASMGTLMSHHIAFTGLTASEVRSYNSNLMILIGNLIRIMGFLYLNYVITNLYVLFVGFRKKEKWAWHIILISGVIVLIPHLFITYLVASMIGYVSIIISTIIWLIALVISYKVIFK